MKPRIKLDPTRPGWGKWECFSIRISSQGNQYRREGKGYTLQEAYTKWYLAGPRPD